MARRTARGREEIAVWKRKEGWVGDGATKKITLGFFYDESLAFLPFALFAFPKYDCFGKDVEKIVVFFKVFKDYV